MTRPSVQVLQVEDNPGDARLMEILLAKSKSPVFSCNTAFRLEHALDFLETQKSDVILLDLGLPDATGLEALERIRKKSSEIPIVVLTGLDDNAMALDALHQGAQDYLVKGSFEDKLVSRILQYSIERSSAIKELSRVNQELVNEMNERKQLEKAILEVREEEQRRLGRDLHDDLGQQLTGIALMTKLLVNRLNEKRGFQAKEAESVLQKVNLAIDTTRRISKGLYAVELESNDLISALDNLVTRVREASGMVCSFSDRSRYFAPKVGMNQHIYRIVQEALNNASKHGRAKSISVEIASDRGETTLTVKDDGIGFSFDTDIKNGLGLQIMKFRAGVIGADLRILSSLGQGTIISLNFGNSGQKVTHPEDAS